MRVSPARLTAVRLDPTVPLVVAMSVTVAEVPSSVRTRAATSPVSRPAVSIRKVPTASVPVWWVTYPALATKKLSLGAVGNSVTTPTYRNDTVLS